MTSESPSWLRPDGKRKYKKVDKVKQDRDFWAKCQSSANNVLPQPALLKPEGQSRLFETNIGFQDIEIKTKKAAEFLGIRPEDAKKAEKEFETKGEPSKGADID